MLASARTTGTSISSSKATGCRWTKVSLQADRKDQVGNTPSVTSGFPRARDGLELPQVLGEVLFHSNRHRSRRYWRQWTGWPWPNDSRRAHHCASYVNSQIAQDQWPIEYIFIHPVAKSYHQVLFVDCCRHSSLEFQIAAVPTQNLLKNLEVLQRPPPAAPTQLPLNLGVVRSQLPCHNHGRHNHCHKNLPPCNRSAWAWPLLNLGFVGSQLPCHAKTVATTTVATITATRTCPALHTSILKWKLLKAHTAVDQWPIHFHTSCNQVIPPGTLRRLLWAFCVGIPDCCSSNAESPQKSGSDSAVPATPPRLCSHFRRSRSGHSFRWILVLWAASCHAMPKLLPRPLRPQALPQELAPMQSLCIPK